MDRRSHRIRPRYGRIAALTGSVLVTGVATLGALGVVSPGATAAVNDTARPASYESPPSPATGDATVLDPSSGADATAPDSSAGQGFQTSHPAAQKTLPASSGTGRRVVFSEHLQRVWLVGATDDTVQRTYLVSGSLTDNLQPGTYSVYSRSRHAIGVADSGTMKYFVRFTQGPTGAAIGFHSIPVKDGHAVQSVGRLGTPTSHGCIRQGTSDAIAMWAFARTDTTVVVVP